ncbi:Flp family type IVb pilin [Pseudoduganella sp. GCM10020061]|uniref:Flp family type IVb pilin n=1 Tax=Pseudoduganella sp. GCM10020061 TaxID=3317345 RepID=UPI0036455C35
MKSIAKFVRYFRRDQTGITTIEYAMIAAVIAIGLITVGEGLVTAIGAKFTDIATQLSAA